MSVIMCLMLLSSSMKPVETPKGFIQKGKASFYSRKFNGRKTTSGERVNPDVFSAAHKTLPFNTLVEVTNLHNNRSVIVRINDRGPHIKGRIIDLSRAAAKSLGIVSRGIANVKLRVVGARDFLTAGPNILTHGNTAHLLSLAGPATH